ncbi:MAG TPA: AAA family ATPase [Gemmata sp.]|nr:AAA family ATPase [Gemmata sp.]
MITRAKFENFKALRDVEITFDSRLTVLVGPNGSGKTSVLQGIHTLGQFARRSDLPKRFRVSTPRDQGVQWVYGWESEPQTLIDERSLPGSRIEVESQTEEITPVLSQYNGRRVDKNNIQHQFSFTHNNKPIHFVHPFLTQLRSTIHLQLDPVQLRYPSLPQSITPVTRSDGHGLATTMAHLLRKYPEQFQAIIESLQRVIPNIVRIRLDLEEFSTPNRFADVLIFDFKGASGVSPISVSDGTMIVLGFLSIILGPEQPQLILLDDLDHRLHPKAQMQLVDLLRKLLDQFPNLQIIATSHSPYILDRLDWNEVRVTALNEDGSAMCKPLTDHPDFERWKESMSPGEFWSTFYEDWLTKSREPQPVP